MVDFYVEGSYLFATILFPVLLLISIVILAIGVWLKNGVSTF
jgi:hypothetical protein